jgi:hypothetical protein
VLRPRLHQHGARFWRQSPPDDDHTVFILIHMNGATLVAMCGLASLGQSIDTAPAAHNALDVAGGAGPADREQPLLGLGRGDARQRPYLGVGELSTGQRIGQPRQRAEGARHADSLAGRTHVDPDPPGKPMRARAEPVVPAAAGIELADEIQQARGRGVEVRGQLSDLMAQPVQLGKHLPQLRRCGVCQSPWANSPLLVATVHPDFGAPSGARRAAIATEVDLLR